MRPWLLAARPKTLPAAVVPVWAGSFPAAFPAWGGEGFRPGLFAATLLSCLCIQVATNLFNDAIDARKGADTRERLGPARVTASGLLPARAVLLGALGFCLLAALLGLPLVLARGWPVLAIGVVSLLMAYAYTGGPFPLAYRGMGELFVILFFGLVAVGGSWHVQTGLAPGWLQGIVGLQAGLYSAVLIAINNLRDVAEDRRSGKRTLAARFGLGFARAEIAAFCLAPALLALLAGAFLGSGWLALPALLLPLGWWITRQIRLHPPGRIYNRFLALSALQLVAYALLLTVGLACGGAESLAFPPVPA